MFASAIALGATALGAGVSAMGSISAGNAKAGGLNYQAGMAKINADIQRQNADYERQSGDTDAYHAGMKSRYQLGGIISKQAASNLDVNTGSAARVQESQGDIGRLDQNQIRANSARKAYAFDTEAWNQDQQAKLYEAGADSAKKAGTIGAISSILGGAASVSGKWMQASSTGMLGSTTSSSSIPYYAPDDL